MGVSVPTSMCPPEIKRWLKNVIAGSKKRLENLEKAGVLYKEEKPGIGEDLKPLEFQFLAVDNYSAVYVFWRTPYNTLYESSIEVREMI